MLAARSREPLQLPSQLGNGPIDSGRRVVAHGHFDPRDEMVLRGRVQNGGPGIQVVTPFILDSSAAVLWVVRGFVASPDAVTPPEAITPPEAGDLTIQGFAYELPQTADSGQPLIHAGHSSWRRLDRAVVQRRRSGSLPVYLLLQGDESGPGRLPTEPPAPLTDGPHLSYAIQWFGIAFAVILFGVIVLWRDGRASPRRREAP